MWCASSRTKGGRWCASAVLIASSVTRTRPGTVTVPGNLGAELKPDTLASVWEQAGTRRRWS